MNIFKYPETFDGPKSCFDCIHFKMTIKNQRARCVKHLLLKEDTLIKNGNICEGAYHFTAYRWKEIKKGNMDKDWSFANICSEYDSMLDDEPAKGGVKIGK